MASIGRSAAAINALRATALRSRGAALPKPSSPLRSFPFVRRYSSSHHFVQFCPYTCSPFEKVGFDLWYGKDFVSLWLGLWCQLWEVWNHCCHFTVPLLRPDWGPLLPLIPLTGAASLKVRFQFSSWCFVKLLTFTAENTHGFRFLQQKRKKKCRWWMIRTWFRENYYKICGERN